MDELIDVRMDGFRYAWMLQRTHFFLDWCGHVYVSVTWSFDFEVLLI